MEIVQLCKDISEDTVGRIVKLQGSRMEQGPIPVQVYTNDDSPFAATIEIEGTIASDTEVDAGTAVWSVIGGASWTHPTLDALFAQPTHIRAKVRRNDCRNIYKIKGAGQ